ncbi:Serine/threonine-protein kinase STE20 [Diplonema papillatum]|nr:Serine/threonine-protein kinase STE20 [Diplonema papillatum]
MLPVGQPHGAPLTEHSLKSEVSLTAADLMTELIGSHPLLSFLDKQPPVLVDAASKTESNECPSNSTNNGKNEHQDDTNDNSNSNTNATANTTQDRGVDAPSDAPNTVADSNVNDPANAVVEINVDSNDRGSNNDPASTLTVPIAGTDLNGAPATAGGKDSGSCAADATSLHTDSNSPTSATKQEHPQDQQQQQQQEPERPQQQEQEQQQPQQHESQEERAPQLHEQHEPPERKQQESQQQEHQQRRQEPQQQQDQQQPQTHQQHEQDQQTQPQHQTQQKERLQLNAPEGHSSITLPQHQSPLASLGSFTSAAGSSNIDCTQQQPLQETFKQDTVHKTLSSTYQSTYGTAKARTLFRNDSAALAATAQQLPPRKSAITRAFSRSVTSNMARPLHHDACHAPPPSAKSSGSSKPPRAASGAAAMVNLASPGKTRHASASANVNVRGHSPPISTHGSSVKGRCTIRPSAGSTVPSWTPPKPKADRPARRPAQRASRSTTATLAPPTHPPPTTSAILAQQAAASSRGVAVAAPAAKQQPRQTPRAETKAQPAKQLQYAKSFLTISSPPHVGGGEDGSSKAATPPAGDGRGLMPDLLAEAGSLDPQLKKQRERERALRLRLTLNGTSLVSSLSRSCGEDFDDDGWTKASPLTHGFDGLLGAAVSILFDFECHRRDSIEDEYRRSVRETFRKHDEGVHLLVASHQLIHSITEAPGSQQGLHDCSQDSVRRLDSGSNTPKFLNRTIHRRANMSSPGARNFSCYSSAASPVADTGELSSTQATVVVRDDEISNDGSSAFPWDGLDRDATIVPERDSTRFGALAQAPEYGSVVGNGMPSTFAPGRNFSAAVFHLSSPVTHSSIGLGGARRMSIDSDDVVQAVAEAEYRKYCQDTWQQLMRYISPEDPDDVLATQRDLDGQRVQLGEGSYGSVFLARLKKTQRDMAVKVIRLDHLEQSASDIREVVLNEIMVLSSLSHANIVLYHGSFLHKRLNELWCVMECCSGKSLFDIVYPRGVHRPLSGCEIAKVAVDVLSALQYLCSKGWIHRDIKLENILSDGVECFKLSDFGLSRKCAINEIFTCSSIEGTLEYLGPEGFNSLTGLLTGKPSCTTSHRGDIYAFGVCVLMMVGVNTRRTIHRPEAYRVPRYNPQRYGPDNTNLTKVLSPTLLDFVSSCLADEPSQRHSAEALLKY